MKIFARFVVIASLLFVIGCGQQASKAAEPVVQAAPADHVAEAAAIEKEFVSLNGHRQVAHGWVAEVRPGDSRDARGLGDDIRAVKVLDEKLGKLPNSDRNANLRQEMRTTMLEDCKLLLQLAQRTQDIYALGDFLRNVEGLDVGPEEFGIKTADLKAQALIMAKKEAAENRTRIHDGSGDAIGSLKMIMAEWGFTPKDLGFSAEDAKQFVELR